MKRKFIKAIILLSIVTATGALSNLYSQTFSGAIAGGSVPRGGSAKGTIVMNIPGGLHVNSNRPRSEYAIPTSLRLTGSGITIAGVSYPRGANRKFQFSEDTINVYEGRVVFGFTVKVPPGFRGSTIRVRATVRYQACTDEVCYPPKNKDITLTARVR